MSQRFLTIAFMLANMTQETAEKSMCTAGSTQYIPLFACVKAIGLYFCVEAEGLDDGTITLYHDLGNCLFDCGKENTWSLKL